MLNWGVIGLGKIAHLFVQDLLLLEDHTLTAVASRSKNKADTFATKYKAISAYSSYDELLSDPSVDVVYIATPHDSHQDWTIKALEKGKHVATNKFLMEAFWSRFNPSIREIIDRCRRGDIGEVNYVNAEFSFLRNDSPDSRMLNMDRAGGSLLDMGVYPVFLAYVLMGVPEEVKAIGTFHETGADLQTASVLRYPNGVANLMSGFRSDSGMVARVSGTKGRFTIDRVWHETQSYTEHLSSGEKRFLLPTKGKGFTYEIEEVKSCIDQGLIESPSWSHKNSLELIGITDEIRNQCGLKYPFE